MKCQFGSTPGAGCQDSTFTIKTIIHIRHNHNLLTWVVFTDLVKSFEISNHALLISILGKYGAPPRLFLSIKHTHDKIVVKLVIGKIEKSIDFKVGVKKLYSMYPVLFMFLTMTFSKTLEDEWTALVLSKTHFLRKYNSPISTKQLVSHQPVTFTSGTLFNIFCMFYVDDSSFVFESSTNIEKWITLLSDHFSWFGLEMYIGTKKILQD